MHRIYLSFLIGLINYTSVLAETVTYDWNITWVWASPDGYGRPVIGINNAWPCPVINAFLGDTVVINLSNKLGNETSGIHFHGINQLNSNYMDGSVGSSQCPLPPNYSITYSFLVRRKHGLNHLYTEEKTKLTRIRRAG